MSFLKLINYTQPHVEHNFSTFAATQLDRKYIEMAHRQ